MRLFTNIAIRINILFTGVSYLVKQATGDIMLERLFGQPTLGPEDFADLFRRYSRQLFRIAYSYVRDEDTAYDMVQIAFEKAMQHADSFKGNASAKSWLTSILVNTTKNYLRDTRKFVDDSSLESREESAPTMGELPVNPQKALTNNEEMTQLALAFATLSERQQEVVRLRVEMGLSYKEVASALEITANDARVNYHLAVKKLKTAMQDEQFVSGIPDTGN